MTLQPQDRDLADRFARLRREERNGAPTFANVTARRALQRSRRVPFVLGLAVALAAAAIVGVLIERDAARREVPSPLDLRAARWTAPTDFLLNTPGHWLLRDLPRIAAPASMQFDTVLYRRVSSS